MRLLGDELAEALNELARLGFLHLGKQRVVHLTLAEQGVGAALDRVHLEPAVEADLLAGGTEDREQHNRQRAEQQKPIATHAFGDMRPRKAHAEVNVLAAAKTLL